MTKNFTNFTIFLTQQARNQEFFRAGEFSSNKGTSITFTYNTRKKGPAEKNLRVFPLETLKNFILIEKLYP